MKNEICKIKDCTNVLKKKHGHICPMHRARFHRHGDYNFISPNWTNLKKGTPCLTNLGYLRININGKRVLQHRHVMEQSLERKLTKKERIHHKNGIKTDNRIENLELFKSNGEHMKKKHPKVWTRYKTADIVQILTRLTMPKSRHKTCFCGRKHRSRNLCEKHFHWAYSHNFHNIFQRL